MKKSLFILSLVASVVSCTNEGLLLDENLDEAKASYQYVINNRRSFEEVVAVAENSISMLLNDDVETRSHESERTLNLSEGVKVICESKTRANSAGTINDTLLYIFNFNDDHGFAVVSASRQTEPLIAIVEEGNYDPDELTGNPAFDTFMQMAKSYVSSNDNNPKEELFVVGNSTSSNPIMCRPVYDTIYNKKVEPLVSVRWGQEGRTGQLCPNLVSGCSNTAIAQIMSYYQYPTTLNLTYPDRDVNTTMLNWSSICNHKYTNCSTNRDIADLQIGRLVRQIGMLSNSTYGEDETGTTPSNARSALVSLGYNVGPIVDYTQGANNAISIDAGYPIATGLSNDRLVYMYGYGLNSDNERCGHAWIIDGCYYVKALYRLMATYDGVNWTVYQEMGTYRTCHNHINWGWDGKQNGYFLSSILCAHNVLQRDPNTGSTSSSEPLSYYDDAKYFFVWR